MCGELDEECDDVTYFPSYEVITGNFNRGQYYHTDLREVTEAGVNHVMRLFMKHFTTSGETADGPAIQPDGREARYAEVSEAVNRAAAVICDEEALDK